MRLVASPEKKISTRQLTIAAEKIAAARFALCGFDVQELDGHTRFDLGVKKSGSTIKISVYGSLDGFWDLVGPYLDTTSTAASREDYHRAIDKWLERHRSSAAYCLVQFESTDLEGMPRVYLASAADIANKLHETADRLGDSALYEQYEVTQPDGSHSVEGLPSRWRFSQSRIAELMEQGASARQKPLEFRFSSAPRCKACAAAQPAACLDCLPMMN